MIHTFPIRIYYQDTDAGGIVYHSLYLNFAERARAEFLRDINCPVGALLERGVAFVLRHIDMDFKAPARLDELLTVRTRIGEMKNASITMIQEVVRDEKLLVKMTLQLAFINPHTLTPIRIPADIKTLFQKYQQETEK